MFRVGTHTHHIEAGETLGRLHTLASNNNVSRNHLFMQTVYPSYVEAVVMHNNGCVYRNASSTRWLFKKKNEKLHMRDGDQFCLLFRRNTGRRVLTQDLDMDCLFTFVADYDSDETIADPCD